MLTSRYLSIRHHKLTDPWWAYRTFFAKDKGGYKLLICSVLAIVLLVDDQLSVGQQFASTANIQSASV